MDLDQVLDHEALGVDDEELDEDGLPSPDPIVLVDDGLVDDQALADMLKDQWDLDPKEGITMLLLNVIHPIKDSPSASSCCCC